MWAHLFYYLAGVFGFLCLYEYYRNTIRKQIAELDFLQNLEGTHAYSTLVTKKRTLEELKADIRSFFYFTRIRIIFGIDLSASNEWQGRKTFGKQSLHKTQANKVFNPYQKTISHLGPIFEEIFSPKVEYSCFGFGDEETKDFAYFPIVATGEEFNSHQLILDAYLEQTKNVVLSGPTSFTPIIKKLISYGIHCDRDFTMLVILTDESKFSHEDKAFLESIRTLTSLPNTCLIIIGVGDGPWQKMSYEEHRIRELIFQKVYKKKEKIEKKSEEQKIVQSKFSYDNFHFVDYNSVAPQSEKNNTENQLALAVLAKLPTQLKQAFHNDRHNEHF